MCDRPSNTYVGPRTPVDGVGHLPGWPTPTVWWSVLTECEGIRTSLISCKTDHIKWLRRWWAYSKKHEIKVHLPPQQLNYFVNGFAECVQGVRRYLNEPKSIQNGLVLIENYQCDQEGSPFVPFPYFLCLPMTHIHFPSMWTGRECASSFQAFCDGCV